MVPAIISCIDAAIDDLEFLTTRTYNFKDLMSYKRIIFWLWNLKIFVVCAKKLRNNTSLGSFLVRIEGTIRQFAEEIHLQRSGSDLSGDIMSKFRDELQSLEDEVDRWYVTLFDHPQDSTPLTADQVSEIIAYIMDGLTGSEYIELERSDLAEIVGEAMEALREQLRFLSCLIWHATQTSVEPGEDFLARSETVALDAASLFFASRVDALDKEEFQLKISALVRRIKPIDPQVYEAYTQVLRGSDALRGLLPSTEDMDDKVTSASEIVLNTLISNLWEILIRLDTCVVDQLKELYGGLRSLRYILKQHPDKFDLKIGAVLCDAAVFIWPFYRTNPEVDLEPGLQDLLQTINNILAEVGQQDPQIPIFDFPRTNELGFLDLLLEKLMAFTTSEAEPIAKSPVEIIREELGFLRPFMGKLVELRNEQEELQALWDRVLVVVNKIESLIDHPVIGDLPNSFSTSFDSVIQDVMEIKTAVSNTLYGERQEFEVQEATSTYNQMPSQRTPSAVNEVVGFDNEARSIKERLTRGSRSLRIIAIVGMAGSGKTTLGTKVFNDPSVMYHFQVRAWCTLSQTLNRRKVLLDLLNQIDPKSPSEKSEDDLANELRQNLKRRRYLIFLDDVWEIEAWNRLTMDGLLFPDDAVGSRIILTSRRHDTAPPRVLDQEPHVLRQLEKEESLELLQKKLSPQNDWPLELHDILGQIAEVCKGLPLTLVIVAGLLATIEPGRWKEILDDLSLGLGSVVERCTNTLELSFKNLPNDLRLCLLYFGAFEEDQEVSVRKLIRLWIAEGFVQKTHEVKSVKDAAEDYLKDLIGRSLIMVAQQKSDGGVKTCRIHDLLLEFCVEKAKNEQFFHFLRGRDELLAFSEPSNLRRLCIRSKAEHFKQSQLFCPGAHTLLFNCSPDVWVRLEVLEKLPNISFIMQVCKLLKVLDLQSIYLVNGFPDEIVLLVQLAFFSIGGDIDHIPSSIDRLSNLETLILDTEYELLLPGSLWNLQKLQCLYIRMSTDDYGGGCGGAIFAIENLDSSPILYELDSFSGVAIPWGSMGRLLKKFPNIRRLKCRLVDSADEEDTADVESADEEDTADVDSADEEDTAEDDFADEEHTADDDSTDEEDTADVDSADEEDTAEDDFADEEHTADDDSADEEDTADVESADEEDAADVESADEEDAADVDSEDEEVTAEVESADEEDTADVDFQSQLESVHVVSNNEFCRKIFEFSFPKTVKKVSLTSLLLSARNISMIGKMTTLKILKLNSVLFERNTWEMKEGEFLKLEFLKLSSISGLKWTGSDDYEFGCLKKLVLESVELDEIPSCLEIIPTLEIIDVFYCKPPVIQMVRQIEEQQLSNSNSSLKINIVYGFW